MSPAVADRRLAGELSLWSVEADLDTPAPAPVVKTLDASERTLEDALASAWSPLATGFTAECLLCGGAVHPRWSAGAGVVGGRCADCGTEIE